MTSLPLASLLTLLTEPIGVAHYLVVDPDQPLIIHHARGNNDTILTRIVREGTIALEPPGLDLALDDVYGVA